MLLLVLFGVQVIIMVVFLLNMSGGEPYNQSRREEECKCNEYRD